MKVGAFLGASPSRTAIAALIITNQIDTYTFLTYFMNEMYFLLREGGQG